MSDNYNGTVVTCRVRFARNLSGYLFPATLKDRAKATEIINRTFRLTDKFAPFKYYEMSKISKDFAEHLKERYIISEALKKNTFSGAVAVNTANGLSVMVNEEDHIRSQCILKGENLITAYNKLVPLDRWLNNNLRFCQSAEYGYITACPTNLGTGLRASAMLFLPTLTKNNMIDDLYRKAKPRGLTVRGVFGEGSQGESCLYQLSNEVTLGKSEREIISEVQSYLEEVVNIEKINSITYYNKNKLEVEDECLRALALLQNCKLLSYEEFAVLTSKVKWGATLNIIRLKDADAFNDLITSCRPATLKLAITNQQTVDNRVIGGLNRGVTLSGNAKEDERYMRYIRAEYVKNTLKKIIV